LKGCGKGSHRNGSRIDEDPKKSLLCAARWGLIFCLLFTSTAGIRAQDQSQQALAGPIAIKQPAATETQSLQQIPSPSKSGSISGNVVDKDGAVIANAKITLTQPGMIAPRETISDGDGHFSFPDVSPGAFQLNCSAASFAPQDRSGILQPGQDYVLPQIEMAIGLAVIDLEVSPQIDHEIAEQQIHVQETQRVLGVIPNFYVSYVPNAVPLTKGQKFRLAWKSSIDPVWFGVSGLIAGFEQANDDFKGYGQGAQGFAKRFGASYADLFSGTFIGSAILPSLLKQDPRYFYKGTGTKKSRLFYALTTAVICKGDNGRWQPNYSNMLGSLAAGGISNIYYPASDRNGAGLTFANAAIGIGGSAMAAVFEEFFVRKFTPHLPSQEGAGN
jgi:hypothetical protein